jgi:hypothetical protein
MDLIEVLPHSVERVYHPRDEGVEGGLLDDVHEAYVVASIVASMRSRGHESRNDLRALLDSDRPLVQTALDER